jgi:hypothetical protein
MTYVQVLTDGTWAQCPPPIAVSIGAIVLSAAGIEDSGAGVLDVDGVDSVDDLLPQPATANASVSARMATMLSATYFRILASPPLGPRRSGLHRARRSFHRVQ